MGLAGADYDPMYGSEVWGCTDTAVHEDAPAKARTTGTTPDNCLFWGGKLLDECALRAPAAALPVTGVSVAHGRKSSVLFPGLHSDEDQVFDCQNYTESTTHKETSPMKIQVSAVTLLTTVWRPSPMPWQRAESHAACLKV